MSLTVVTTRDYDNVPTCFEKYELGTMWRINGGNLEVFVGRTLAALYPSGNWVSVYADDAMQLHKGGAKPDYSSLPTVTAATVETAAFEDPLGPPRGIQPNQPVLDPDDDHDDVAWGRPAVVEDPTYGDDSVASEEQQIIPDADIAAARAAMIPVAFRPRRYRAAPPPATKAPTGPRMLPVRLRMRPYRAAREVEAAATTGDAAGPRMIPVTMRTTIYRAARHLRSGTEPADEITNEITEDQSEE